MKEELNILDIDISILNIDSELFSELRYIYNVYTVRDIIELEKIIPFFCIEGVSVFRLRKLIFIFDKSLKIDLKFKNDYYKIEKYAPSTYRKKIIEKRKLFNTENNII